MASALSPVAAMPSSARSRAGVRCASCISRDFDPAGRSMPVASARKIEFWLRHNHPDLDVTVDPLALLPEQAEHYGLPRTPIKEGESRAGKFEERFGRGATEIDALEALHPGELGRSSRPASSGISTPIWLIATREARRAIDERIEQVEEEVHGQASRTDRCRAGGVFAAPPAADRPARARPRTVGADRPTICWPRPPT